MPMGMPYPKGKMAMQKGKMSLGQMMGMETSEHGKKMRGMGDVMKAETKEYGKRPASKAALMRGEMKEHGGRMRGKK
jgi:hypothetical protein